MWPSLGLSSFSSPGRSVGDFGAGVAQACDPAQKNLDAWFGRVAGRPSAEQSLHPAAVTAGMRA